MQGMIKSGLQILLMYDLDFVLSWCPDQSLQIE